MRTEGVCFVLAYLHVRRREGVVRGETAMRRRAHLPMRPSRSLTAAGWMTDEAIT